MLSPWILVHLTVSPFRDTEGEQSAGGVGRAFLRHPKNPRVPRLRAAAQAVAAVHVGDNKDSCSRDVIGPAENGLPTWVCLPGTPLVRARSQQGAPVLRNEELANRVIQSFSGSSQS